MNVTFSSDDLRPIVEACLAQMLERFGGADRLCYSEAEAAGLLGVKPHVLRDCRLRGQISGSKLGRGWSYQRGDLIKFLEARREA